MFLFKKKMLLRNVLLFQYGFKIKFRKPNTVINHLNIAVKIIEFKFEMLFFASDICRSYKCGNRTTTLKKNVGNASIKFLHFIKYNMKILNYTDIMNGFICILINVKN